VRIFAQEEVVRTLQTFSVPPFTDEADACGYANDSPFGLAAGRFRTRDFRRRASAWSPRQGRHRLESTDHPPIDPLGPGGGDPRRWPRHAAKFRHRKFCDHFNTKRERDGSATHDQPFAWVIATLARRN